MSLMPRSKEPSKHRATGFSDRPRASIGLNRSAEKKVVTQSAVRMAGLTSGMWSVAGSRSGREKEGEWNEVEVVDVARFAACSGGRVREHMM